MNTRVSSNKKQTAFRFSEDLLERLKVRSANCAVNWKGGRTCAMWELTSLDSR